MISKTIRDYPIKEKNPFTEQTYLSKNKSFSVTVLNNNDKVAISLTSLCKVKKDSEIPKIIGKILKNKLRITKGGVNIYEYIYKNSDWAKEEYAFKIDFDDCCNKIGYSSTQSVWYGLAELLDKNILARSETRGVYYLNPIFFQKANTVVVTDYYKPEQEQEPEKEKTEKPKKSTKQPKSTKQTKKENKKKKGSKKINPFLHRA